MQHLAFSLLIKDAQITAKSTEHHLRDRLHLISDRATHATMRLKNEYDHYRDVRDYY